jgi:hypothetical protein
LVECKKNKIKVIIPLGLNWFLILKRNKKSSIKKFDTTYVILNDTIDELKQELKKEKVLHQLLIKQIDDKKE